MITLVQTQSDFVSVEMSFVSHSYSQFCVFSDYVPVDSSCTITSAFFREKQQPPSKVTSSFEMKKKGTEEKSEY